MDFEPVKHVTTKELKGVKMQDAPIKEHATNYSIVRAMGHLNTSYLEPKTDVMHENIYTSI